MTPFSEITEHTTGFSHFVPQRRLKKAMKMLRADRILTAIHPSSCSCSRKCTIGITTSEILRYRSEEVLHCLPADEAGCTSFLAASIRRTLAENKGGQAYRWGGKLVCRELFAAVAGKQGVR